MIYYFSLLVSFRLVSGLYFELKEFESIHFIEDIPESTTVVGNYICELKNIKSGDVKISRPGSCMLVQVYDPSENLVLSKTYGDSGKFYFQSNAAGEHFISVSLPLELKYESSVASRIHLNIVTGEESVDYMKIMEREKLNNLEIKYRRLIEQLKDIQKEQNYQRLRESRFRRVSENISYLVLTFAWGQIILLVIITVIQTKHLKHFFLHKKLL